MSGIQFTQPTISPAPVSLNYGAFSDITPQSITAPFQVKTINIATTDFSNGVTLGANQLVFASAGVYNIQVSLQITNSSVQDHDFYFWFAKNSLDIPNSSSIITINSRHGGINGHMLPAMNIFVSVNAGDNIELRWTANDTGVQLEAVVPPLGVPIAPSVILTAIQV